MADPRPGIASTDRPRSGPFADLVAQILDDSIALDALAFAYSDLATEGRRGLIRAVVHDASDPGPVLGALLAVESNSGIAMDLTGLLARHARSESFCTLEERLDGGEACLVQARFGFARELMRITWNRSQITKIDIESRIQLKSVSEDRRAPITHAVEAVAPLLWRHIKSGGALPDGVERFAAFFSVA